MKKIICFVLIFSILFSLVGCSRRQELETNMTLDDIAAAIMESQPELPNMQQIDSESEEFATWLTDYYFLSAENVENGVISYAEGVEASEITVLLFQNENDCETAEEALVEYIGKRTDVFEGYAPQQAAMVKEAEVAVNGRYIALLICPEPDTAKTAFLSCFGTTEENGRSHANNQKDATEIGNESVSASVQGAEAASEAVGTEEFYNAETVLQAFRSGDDSSLSETNRSILNAAKEVIASEISDGMSDYEKELAIHDYITNWSSFDYGVFGHSSDGFTDGSDTPYGVLIERSAMCHGYSSTFQLFMDMLDIECITVFGIPGSNGVEHSWNMVKLDGEWYCVDCAWDDPIGGSPGHTYFNVTSDELRNGSIHRWEESSVPEATGTAYAYGNQRQ